MVLSPVLMITPIFLMQKRLPLPGLNRAYTKKIRGKAHQVTLASVSVKNSRLQRSRQRNPERAQGTNALISGYPVSRDQVFTWQDGASV